MASSIVRLAILLCLAFYTAEAHAQGQPAAAPAAASSQLLKAEELDQLVAPIALYPDTLLANVLMASTYPLEVVQADRWATANKSLKGEQLKASADKQTWDSSVKQLTATPSALNMMATQLDWTQKLGDAVLAQQADVMDAVQRLRTKADAQNTLKTTKEQTVTKRTEQGKQVIVIEPTEPNTVYVPYYDPAVVYGAWPYSAYPPYSYPPYGGYLAGGLVGFGVGVAVGAWAANNNYWGGGLGWGNNNINVNRPVNINNVDINKNNWQHNAEHRGGVRYNNSQVAQKFGQGNRPGAEQRMDFRGRDGQQVLKPGGDRPGGDRPGVADRAGDRGPGGGDRPGAGDRKGGDRPAAADRKGGDRPGAGDRGGQRPGAGGGGQRPSAGQRPGGGREGGLGNVNQGRAAMAHGDRGRASMGGGGGGQRMGGGHPGGGARAGAGGGPRGGGGARGGGGRRSDIALKHDIVQLGMLDNGLGFYRFAYHGSDKAYVGVMAQEVEGVMPDAVVRGRDGYLRVRYEKIGLKFESYDRWMAAGARIPAGVAGGVR